MKGSFPSFFILYQLLYKSRIILEDTDYSTYSGYLPDWLYYWSALSTKPPLPGFYSLPAGRTKKTWGRNHDVNNSVVWEEGKGGRGGEGVECIIFIICTKVCKEGTGQYNWIVPSPVNLSKQRKTALLPTTLYFQTYWQPFLTSPANQLTTQRFRRGGLKFYHIVKGYKV